MITSTKGYTSSDGAIHASIEAAQRAELLSIFSFVEQGTTTTAVVNTIFGKADEIVDILTTKPRSRPKMRKIHRGKAASPEKVKAGIKKMREAVDAPQADEVAA